MAIGMATAVTLLAGCSNNSSSGTNNPGSSQPPPQQQAAHGPFFPECGGISDQTVGQLTQARGLVNTGRNSAGCQWLQNGGIIGPNSSLTGYPGTPIGRE